jgi:hypothetical protein
MTQNIIEYIGSDKKWTQFYLDSFIPKNKTYTFSIKVLRTL